MQTENLTTRADKKNYFSIILSVIFVLICGQRGMAMGLILFFLPLLIWFPYSIYIAIQKPSHRKWQLVKMAIWLIAIAIVIVLHNYYQKQTRQNADAVLAKIEEYYAKNKTYPADAAVIGINSTYKDAARSDVRYGFTDNLGMDKTPYLFYISTTNMFDTYHYDFQKKSWRFFPD
jgi:hypothetical protein